MKRLSDEEHISPPVILNRSEGSPQSQVPVAGEDGSFTAFQNDGVWNLSELEAQIVHTYEDRD